VRSGAEFVNVQPGPPRPGAVQLGPGIGSPPPAAAPAWCFPPAGAGAASGVASLAVP